MIIRSIIVALALVCLPHGKTVKTLVCGCALPRYGAGRPPRADLRGRRIAKAHPDRNRAILAAHDTGGYSYAHTAQHFGVHFTTAVRIVRAGRRIRRKVKD
jgi:hypothetical protein